MATSNLPQNTNFNQTSVDIVPLVHCVETAESMELVLETNVILSVCNSTLSSQVKSSQSCVSLGSLNIKLHPL